MTSWNNEATIIAPWICLILNCHTWVFSSSVIVSKSVGHSFSGKDNMAIVGTRNENVPPWTMGSLCELINYVRETIVCLTLVNTLSFVNCTHLTPNVTCKRVTIPLTKNKVDMIYPLAGSSSEMHKSGVNMNGIDTVEPNIVLLKMDLLKYHNFKKFQAKRFSTYKYCWNPNRIHMYQGGTSSTE